MAMLAINIESGDGPIVYHCPVCPRSFRNPGALKEHIGTTQGHLESLLDNFIRTKPEKVQMTLRTGQAREQLLEQLREALGK